MTLVATLKFSGKLPKGGYLPSECEDHFAIDEDSSKFAMADGATEASYSGIWARILVESFREFDSSLMIPGEVETQFDSWLGRCRATWIDWEGSLNKDGLPWFASEKLLSGSAATFIGVSFESLPSPASDQLSCKAVALGDSCLFIVRDNWLRECFPIDNASNFGPTPALVRTLSYPIGDNLQVFSSVAIDGERVYLTTDALGKWFLELCERGEEPWKLLDSVSTPPDFENLVEVHRANRSLRDDDTSLIAIEIKAET